MIDKTDMVADTPESGGVRLAGQLLRSALSLIRCRKLEFILLALPVLASDVVSRLLIVNGTNMILAEPFSGVWDRITAVRDTLDADEPSRWLQEHWNVLESTQWEIANLGLPLLASGLLIYLATIFIHISALSHICLLSPEGSHRNVVRVTVDALRWGVSRVPRLSALFAKIFVAGIAVIIVLAVFIVLGIATTPDIDPLSVALFAGAGLSVLALTVILVLLLLPGILVVAFVASAIGSTKSPVRYAFRLVRDRFLTTLASTYLIVLVAILIGISSELVVSAAAPDQWYATYLISSVIEVANFSICTAGICVLYRDLGGEHA